MCNLFNNIFFFLNGIDFVLFIYYIFTGKRNCPGELFADVTAFLVFLNFIRKFKLSCIPGEPKPRTEMHVVVSSCPYPFAVLMTKR